MLAAFVLPFLFQFAPFVHIEIVVHVFGIPIPAGSADISGGDMYILTMLNFRPYAVVIQIGLWLTTMAGTVMIVLAILRFFNFEEKTFTIRTVTFYVYLVGTVFMLIGTIMALGNARWGLIVYTIFTILAVVARIITDGKASSFKIIRKK
jgi:hypothetical protein